MHFSVAHGCPNAYVLLQQVLSNSSWFYTETGQADWMEAMELNTLTPDMPDILMEMGEHCGPAEAALQGCELSALSIASIQVPEQFRSNQSNQQSNCEHPVPSVSICYVQALRSHVAVHRERCPGLEEVC